MSRHFTISIALWTCLAAGSVQAQHDLASGQWFKLAVDKPGVYRIDFNFLKKLGIDPSRTDPSTPKILGNRGGMLPQSLSTPTEQTLTENAIYVAGESDGRFDAQDFILFYADGPDRIEFDAAHDIFQVEHNLYSDRNFYFLGISEGQGKRVTTATNAGDGFPPVTTFNDYHHHETDDYSDRRSGREWFGEKFGISTNVHIFNLAIEGIIPGSPIRIVSDVMGQSHSPAQFTVSFNGVQLGEQPIAPVPNTRYGVKGIHNRDTFQIDASAAGAVGKNEQQLRIEFKKATGFSQGYLDFFLISVERELKLYGDQTIFLSSRSVSNPVSQFELAAPSPDLTIWDITDVYNAAVQPYSLSGGRARFSSPTEELKRFIAFNSRLTAPEIIGKIGNQDLHAISGVDMVIVSHPLFIDQARRLAAHRESFDNLKVAVVTTEEVYNEFSSGRQDVSAIRNFMKHLRDKDPGSLKSLLLFGKASYDYKDRVPNNTNFVVTYQSRNSLHPLQTYSSDDYFGFLEDHEGSWPESPAQNHTLDIGIGRLPVTTASQARSVVDKLVDYDTNKKAFGYWRKKIVFVADDGNNEDGYTSLHQSQADQLAQFIENLGQGVDTKKLFMGSYEKTVRPNGETIPEFTDDLVRAFDRGSLIINYTGHGSETQWGDENVFNDDVIGQLDNKLYPFLVTATCEFGRHDNPIEISSAERAITREKGGVVGMVTTARPVNATTNFNLNLAFYEALFEREQNSYRSLGEVFRHTKNNSTSGVANRNFSLLGDPSQTLALPSNDVHITALETAHGSDTLKALSTVIVRGEVRTPAGEKITGFNGLLEATLFDKETQSVTIGRNDPAFVYTQWNSALFRGQATITDGAFEMTFMMPKNIAYQVAEGRMSLYAYDASLHLDASGESVGFKIGGTEMDVIEENLPPQIRLFMGDTTFVNGGIITPDTYLLARLTDNSGINISGYGIGNNLMASLDENGQAFLLNDYYVADPDNAASGWVRYPINNLQPGPHTLTVRGWDVFNNSAEATINFIVTDGEHLVIESFGNYPNPFADETTLFFTHNRSGDHLQAHLVLQNTAGEVIKTGDFEIENSDHHVTLMRLNPLEHYGKKLPAGLYLARLAVRSLTNGSKNEEVTKLIILN